jgi:ElaB/YqjD/DUF883 family membrane-anchored ribosome-binding protein
MRSKGWLIVLSVVAAACLCAPSITALDREQGRATDAAQHGTAHSPVASHWQLGDSWTVRVDDEPDGPFAKSYLVHIAVTGSESVDGEDCWRLDFERERVPGVPTSDRRHAILVSKKDGRTLRFMAIPAIKTEEGWRMVSQYGDLGLALPPGLTAIVPLETAPGRYPEEHGGHVTVARDQTVDAELEGFTGDVLWRLQQFWPAGATWWSECEAWGRDGHRLFRAKLVGLEERARPVPPVEDESESKAHEAQLRAELDRVLRATDSLTDEAATEVRGQLDAALNAAKATVQKAREQRAGQAAMEAARKAADAVAQKAGETQ